jgi:uncharacterized membrane protein
MAGIGWRLERMIDRDSLGASAGAFLTGVAVTSGPWLLTTLVLVLLRASAEGGAQVEQVVTVVYALVIVMSAPIDIVMSRYASDRVYEDRRDQIATPLRMVVAACLVGFGAVGALAMHALHMPPMLAVPGTVLAAVVGAQWLLLSAAGGLSSPGIILRAFAAGAPISVIAAVVLHRPELLGSLGYLYGFGVGQLVTLALLLRGTLQALPDEEDETATILPSFREYWLLAAAALAFHAGLWIDKLVVYLTEGGSAAGHYSASAALAWLSVVPACAFLFVRIETVFHRRFQAYYSALQDGAPLAALERLAATLRVEVARTLSGTAAVQLGVTLVCIPVAPWVARHLLGGDAEALRWLMAGAGLQVVAMAATLLLYYFDFRREALLAALTQLAASAVGTVVLGPSGAGYTVACALTCGVSVALLMRRMSGLLERTFQSQPYTYEPVVRSAV